LKNPLLTSWGKMPRYKACKIPRVEAYLLLCRSDERWAKRSRWRFSTACQAVRSKGAASERSSRNWYIWARGWSQAVSV